MITALWMSHSVPSTALIIKMMPQTNLISLLGLEQSSVGEECCSRMKYLVGELLRAEQALKSTLRLRRTLMLTSKANKMDIDIDRGHVHGIIVSKGKYTKEWGGKLVLWGVVPLWRAAPPPDTILALRRPTPSDCWPFSGSYGELNLDLPRQLRIRCLSVEHVQPDTALSAPKNFILYGILTNGTWLKAVDGEYRRRGPAKQYYPLLHQNIPFQQFVFRVLNNQGNPRYTCIYRVHLFQNIDSSQYLYK
ncbi:SUN domain-containing protein 5-like [Pectinophora gossypiella]|uniref:SUN domain-containing protein 5-like n=1 Tax=Pectinophora gossypiella TaxID=13191 RepID=UPI00214EB574|nr:SUN domain-containing protein 5-like [Pectinophora gossypiella]